MTMTPSYRSPRWTSVLCLLPVLIIACHGSSPPTESEALLDLPQECSTLLETYSRCVGRTGAKAAPVANAGRARARDSLLAMLKAPNGKERAHDHCVAALEPLRSACLE